MLTEPCILPGSLTSSIKKNECFKCGNERTVSGGIELTPIKWVCAICWRTRASRKQGALAGFKSPRKANG